MMMKNKFELVFFLLFLTLISISSIISQPKKRRYLLKKDKPISTYQFFITTQKRSKKLLALKWISIVGVVGLTVALILKKINNNQEDYLNHQEGLSKKYDLEAQAFYQSLESALRNKVELEMQLEIEALAARHQLEVLNSARQQDSARLSAAQNKLSQEFVLTSEEVGRNKVELEMQREIEAIAARHQAEMINAARQQESARLSVAQNKLSQEFVLTSEEVGRNKVELEMEFEAQNLKLEELIQNIIITNKEQSRLIKQLISQTLTTSNKQDELVNKFNKTQINLRIFYNEFLSIQRSVKEGSGPSIIFNLLRNHVSESNFREREQSEPQNCLSPAEPHFATSSSHHGY